MHGAGSTDKGNPAIGVFQRLNQLILIFARTEMTDADNTVPLFPCFFLNCGDFPDIDDIGNYNDIFRISAFGN